MFTSYDTVHTHFYIVYPHFDTVHTLCTSYDTVHTYFDKVHTHFGTVHTLFTSYHTVHTHFETVHTHFTQFTHCSQAMIQFTHTLT